MENRTELGMNRTGMQMSPVDSKKMLEVTDMTHPSSQGDGIAEVRKRYVKSADPVGSVPAPVTVKGAAKSGAQALTGKRAHVLLDKLGERLAFERSGTRLYEAVMAKCEATQGDKTVPDIGELQHIREEEARHFPTCCRMHREARWRSDRPDALRRRDGRRIVGFDAGGYRSQDHGQPVAACHTGR